MSDNVETSGHNLNLYNRNKLNVTGISSVDSFDDTIISATTSDGVTLYIEGSDIALTDVNLEKKCFEATGNFYSFAYSSNSVKEYNGLFSRLFKAK